MPRNHVKRFVLGLLTLLLGLFAGATQAQQLTITLNPPSLIGPLTYQYTGKITNISTRPVFVNGAGEASGPAALGFDDVIAALPGGSLPFVLVPGSSVEATLFNVTVPVGMPTASFVFLLAHNGASVGQVVVPLPPVPAAPPTGTVSGTVQLDNFTQFYAQAVTFTFRPKDGSAVFSRSALIGRTGAFSFSGIPAKSYTVHIKGVTTLATNVAVDTTNGDVSNVSAFLLEGDADGNNSVDIADFGILIGAYSGDASIPSTGYNYRADFNADGMIDVTDLSILVNNYSAVGAP